MRRDLITAARSVVVLTVVLGLAYPLFVTGASQVLFPGNADGSRVQRDGETVGSELIGQDFGGVARYFQSRPSATEYAPDATFFNNLGPNQKELAKLQRGFLRDYLERELPFNPGLGAADVPPDAVTTSASGIDPQISTENAELQAPRVAEARGMTVDEVMDRVDEHTDGRALGFIGNPGVNVVTLNLALDEES